MWLLIPTAKKLQPHKYLYIGVVGREVAGGLQHYKISNSLKHSQIILSEALWFKYPKMTKTTSQLSDAFQSGGYFSNVTRAIYHLKTTQAFGTSDRSQKQATGKADRRNLDSNTCMNC